MKRGLVLLSISLAVIGGVGGRAISDDLSVEDRSGDGSGSVDLVAGSHGHGVARSGTDFAGSDFSGNVLVHEIAAADEWVFEGEALELRMSSRGWRVPRRLFVRTNPDGSLTGTVFSGDRFRGYANVFKVGSATLRLEVPKSTLGHDVRSYRWRVFGTGGSDDCGEADCTRLPPDRLPDEGAIVHRGLWRYRQWLGSQPGASVRASAGEPACCGRGG